MDVFGSLRGILKTDTTCIDNNIFRLHYKASVIILVACSIIVTSRQYIGEPISCMHTKGDTPKEVVNQFCWIHATFTLPSALNKTVGKEVPHPGIDKYTEKDARTYHSYYQWVCFVLFFQACLFYIPRYVWKIAEGGKMRMLIMNLDNPILSEESKSEKKKLLLEYVMGNLHGHTFYIIMFIVCEVMNFINVVGQIYFMDLFLGGEFTTYGPEVIRFSSMDQEDRVDPMIKVFPRITKCNFHKYGPSGDVQKLDFLCVLPLNIVNEKIYIFLWFWFVILAVVTGLSLLFRIFVVVFPAFRLQLMKMRSRLVQRDYVEIVVRKIQLGDWFVLDLLGKNMDGIVFREFLMELAKKFEGKEFI